MQVSLPLGSSGSAQAVQVRGSQSVETGKDAAAKSSGAGAGVGGAKTRPAAGIGKGDAGGSAGADAKDLEEKAAKKMKAAVKEGGKKGVELAGCADMGGLEFFTTQIEKADGDLTLLKMAMEAGGEARVWCVGRWVRCSCVGVRRRRAR